MLTIGPFARIGGVSAKALRAWDGVGLFRPVWTDPLTSYRFYSPAQLPELRSILGLRDLGLGLAEIRALVVDGADLGEALARRRAELERERRLVERRLAELEIRIEGVDGEPGLRDVVVRPVAPELVATLRLGDDEDTEAAFDELEAHVRDRRRRAHRPPGALLDADGSTELYVPLTGPIPDGPRVRSRRLPGARVASVLIRGGYDGILGARDAVLAWIDRAGLAAAGPTRIVYLQFGADPALRLPAGYVVGRPADYVTEVQVPIG